MQFGKNIALNSSLVQELSAKNDEMTAELQKLKTAMNSGVLQRVTSLQPGSPGQFNPLKCSGVRQLHLKVFSAIQV